jgi:effector-binding domain-containing protein
MNTVCEIKERAATPVMSVRTRCPVTQLPQVLGKTYEKITTYLARIGAQAVYAPFVVYYNMDMDDLDIEAGFPTVAELSGEGEIRAGELPAGKALTATYTGPYETMQAAYEDIEAWAREHNLQRSGVVYEFYHNDPTTTPPEQLITEIVFPLV